MLLKQLEVDEERERESVSTSVPSSVNCNWMGQQEFSKRAGANEALDFILF